MTLTLDRLVDTLKAVAESSRLRILAVLSRGDLSETMETAAWYLKLRGRVEKPEELAGFSVSFSRVPVRLSETERAVADELFRSLPAVEAWLSNRSAYVRMDKEGLLGPIADKTSNRGLAAHLHTALQEAEQLLEEIDQSIAAPAEVA